MDWTVLAQRVAALGAPLLGQALAGPLGAAAGKILAEALEAGAPTPEAVEAALRGTEAAGATEGALSAAAQRAEAAWVQALAEVGRVQVSDVAATQRAEMMSEDALQRWWRPLYALELSMVECPAFTATLLHALWSGHAAGINGFGELSGLLIAYFAARFGVLGVYVSGRSREKRTAPPAATMADRLLSAATSRRG